MSNPPNGYNTISGFNKYKGTYFNSDIDVSGGHIINRTGNLYLASNSSIYSLNNQIQFDDTYSFTNFLNSINVYGQFKLNYSSIEYDVGNEISKVQPILDNKIGTMFYNSTYDFSEFNNIYCSGQIQYEDNNGAHIDLIPIILSNESGLISANSKTTNISYNSGTNTTTITGLLTLPVNSINSTSINNTSFVSRLGGLSESISGIKTFNSTPIMAVNVRIDGGLVLAGGTTVTASNAQLRLIPDIGTLNTKTTAISYTSATTTTVITGVLQFSGTLNGWSTTNFTNAINYAKDLTSSAQTQINTINSNITTLQNGSVSLSALNTFSGATNTFTNNIRHDGSLLLNSGALTITNSNLQKLQYCSTITSDIQSQVTSNTTNITTNTNSINTANTNITNNTNSINTANTNITNNTNSINTSNTNITNLQTKTTGISYTVGTTVLPSITTITNDILNCKVFEFTTSINNISTTVFDRLKNITSDVQAQFTTLTNSISASTVPIATVISNLNPNLQTQSGGQYLLCNGQAVSRTTYANLFAVIGLNFGFPNFDDFYVPNYQGMFLRGQGNQTINGVFYTSSSNYYTFQSDGMQDHTHGGPGGTYLITQYQQPENSLAQGYSKSATNLNRPNSQAIGSSNIMNSPARSSTDTRPGNYSAYYYIKT